MFLQQAAPKRTRLPHKVPIKLIDLVSEKAGKHLPTPQLRHFFQLLLDMGMDDYAAGIPLKKELVPRPKNESDWNRFSHHVTIERIDRLNEFHAEHLPKTSRRAFFEYIIMLGLQAYEREYTIYGFRKD